jgi:hypothetical protein
MKVKGNNMKLKIELSAASFGLDVLSKIAPPSSGTLTFAVDKKLTLMSASDSGYCKVVVPCEVEGSGSFALPLQVFRDAIKGREVFEVNYKNSIATISAKSYKVELSTTDVIPLDEIELGEAKDWVLETEQIEWLSSASKKVELKPTSSFSAWMPLGIKLTDKGGFITCYDSNHVSWLNTKEVNGNFECLLPYTTMANVLSVCKTKFKISHTQSHIKVKSKFAEFVLALPDLDGLPPLSSVHTKTKEASKVTGSQVILPLVDTKAFLENAKSVMGTSERAELQVTAGKNIELSIKTSQGSAKAMVKGEGKAQFRIDSTYLAELLSKMQDDVTLTVVDSAFIAVKLKNGGTIIALNQ